MILVLSLSMESCQKKYEREHINLTIHLQDYQFRSVMEEY